MSFLVYNEYAVRLVPSEDKVHYILPEYQRTRPGCPHGIEFWVAVRTISRNDRPLTLQWCMSCRQVDVILHENNDRSKRLETPKMDDVADWWDRDRG